AVGQMQLRRQHRQQVTDNEEIEEFEDEQRRQQRESHPITPVERRRIEQPQELIGSLSRHRSLPPAPSPVSGFSFVLQRYRLCPRPEIVNRRPGKPGGGLYTRSISLGFLW